MGRAYSMDLRERVVAAVETGGLSCHQAATQFGVGVSSAIRWVGRLRETGSVAPVGIVVGVAFLVARSSGQVRESKTGGGAVVFDEAPRWRVRLRKIARAGNVPLLQIAARISGVDMTICNYQKCRFHRRFRCVAKSLRRTNFFVQPSAHHETALPGSRNRGVRAGPKDSSLPMRGERDALTTPPDAWRSDSIFRLASPGCRPA